MGIAKLPPSQKRTGLEHWLDKTVRSWFSGRILPVTEARCRTMGISGRCREAKGVTLAVVDGVIAATALHHDLILVTRNVKDFAALGVQLFNPWGQENPC
jgi:predicted nucleic acid-binding protein